ncbi:putative tyrosine-tRNA ligase [Babesia sp. Xinjiang]|uniref:putative tyrosine-tRNA ligase n=1 Tax=Babesia sp. Xinjiang TaxID=462227 RepID=UPI000A239A5C|nr:putative tyrosine-tRNA ligase [Babesia sp. Xinjiang]ORM41816.1 putative tyrosine-tRNA ligase [Babesia sp. Xinjiang]
MLEVIVFSDCVEGRLARLLWSYGKFKNVSLSLSPSRTETIVKEDGEVSLKQWPSVLEDAIKGAPTEEVLVPSTQIQKDTMYSWIDFAFQRDFSINQRASIETLNAYLVSHTFLVGSTITLADLVMYVSTHSWMMKSEAHDRAEFTNVVRWFDHVQHLPGIVNNFKDLPLVTIEKDMDLVTAVMENMSVATAAAPPSVKPTKGAADSGSKKQKSPKPVADDRPIADVSRLHIKVGQVMSVERHPEADRLYCLKIDLGEPDLREICSGLVDYLKPEQIMSQYVCVLSNMKPKSLRGKTSNGMVLCVSNADHTVVELLHPAEGTAVGERVVVEGCEGEPDAVLSTKTGKDPFVAVQPEFNCKDTFAYYKDQRFMTKCGPCRCISLKEGTIS